ncbi:MAG: hypothetical protein HEP71_00015 [Roseivirga sp.]|nr:hypothetical protein [Roseivirga sp.]
MKNNTTSTNKNGSKVYRPLMALAIGLSIFLSCSKSVEDGPQILSEMEINGQTYGLGGGILIDWEEVNNGSADYDLVLYSEGIVINQEGQPENAGSFILFDLNSYAPASFEGGTFTFSNERQPGTISGAFLVTDYSGDPNSIPNAIYIASGNVDVTLNGGLYTVNFTLTTIDGDAVSGTYIGELPEQSNN